ncbi:hypothetical protein Tco_0215419 [Tanacetum coccineum]
MKKSVDHSQKLKGIQKLTAKEQLAADTMQALKASNKISRSWSHTGGSGEGVGVTLEVPDESTNIFITSSEGTDTVDKEIECLSTDEEEKKQDDDDDDKSIDIEKTDDDEETDDEYVHDEDYVHTDVDKEMKDAKVAVTGKDDNEGSDAAKADAEKTEEVKGDNKKVGLPLTSSSLFVSSGFVPLIQSPTLLNVHVSVIIEQPVPTPSSTLTTETPVLMVPQPPPIVSAISFVQQQTTPIPTPPITIVALSVTTTVLDPLLAIVQRVSELENDVKELKQVDHSSTILASIIS